MASYFPPQIHLCRCFFNEEFPLQNPVGLHGDHLGTKSLGLPAFY